MNRIMFAFALFMASFSGLAQTVSQTIDPLNCKLFTAATAGADHNSDDVAASTMSKPIDIQKMNKISLHAKWVSLTGSVDAVFKLQVATVPFPSSADWVDKSGASMTLSGATGVSEISITNLTERWARVVYAHTSVSGGTLTGYCHAKSI